MKDLSQDSFKDAIATGCVVVDFWAEWCGPCKMLTPILEELSNEMENISFYKVDADANTELAAELLVTSIPTILMYCDGELVMRQIGAKPKALMRKVIEDAFNMV